MLNNLLNWAFTTSYIHFKGTIILVILTLKPSFNLHFHPHEVVSQDRDPYLHKDQPFINLDILDIFRAQ